MYYLAFETTEFLSIGLFRNESVICLEEKFEVKDPLNDFFSLLDSVLKKSNIDLGQIERVVLNRGPGRFTLTRLGITVGRAFIQFGNYAFSVLSSFDILFFKAINFLNKTNTLDLTIIPILSAPGNKVYTLSYDKDGEKKYERIEYHDLLVKLSQEEENFFLIGSGAWKYREIIWDLGFSNLVLENRQEMHYISSRDLGLTSLEEKILKYNFKNYYQILPLYL